MKPIIIYSIISLLLISFSKGDFVLNKEKDYSNNIVKSDSIIINDLSKAYKELKPHFLFTKATKIATILKHLNNDGNLINKNTKEVFFIKSYSGGQYLKSTQLLGSFWYQNTAFYVFYSYGEACGEFNGISFVPIKTGFPWHYLHGVVGDGDVYYRSVILKQQNNTLLVEIEEEESVSDENDKKPPYKYSVSIEKGKYNVSNDSLVMQITSKKQFIRFYDKNGEIIKKQ